jgi:hypothetical protein
VIAAQYLRQLLRAHFEAVVDVLAIGGVLVAMLIANIEWLFSAPTSVDTWMYFGFFRHYDAPDYLANNKKIARLPWILVGFIVNRLFAPHNAALVLHVGCFALGAFLLYRLIAQMFGRMPAVLTTLAYITWVPLQGAGGWDYHNTLTPAVYFAAYRAMVWAAKPSRYKFLRFAAFGALYALAIHTNLLVLLVLPAFIIRAVHERIGPLQSFIPGFVFGGVAVTALLGLINHLAGRSFYFWNILVSRSVFLVEHPVDEKTWWLPWTNPWWMSDLGTPMLTFVLVLIIFRAATSQKRSINEILSSSSACAMLEFIGAFVLYAIVQTLGHPVLTPFYMAVPLALPMFVAFAALVYEIVGDSGSTTLVILAALVVGIQFVFRLSADGLIYAWRPDTWGSDAPPILILLCGFVIATVIRRFSALETGVKGALAAMILAVAVGQANTMWPILGGDRFPHRYATAECKKREALLAAVASTDDSLYSFMRRGMQVALWYRADEPTGPTPSCQLLTDHLGRALFAMGYGTSYEHFWDPEVEQTIPKALIDNLPTRTSVFVVITASEKYLADVISQLNQKGPHWREIEIRNVGGYGMNFQLHVLSNGPVTNG